MVKHTCAHTGADNKKEITNTHKEQEATDNLDMKTNLVRGFLPTCQSLVSPKMLLSGAAVTLRGGSLLPHKSNGLVLCSTTVSCLSSPDNLDQTAEREAPRLVNEEERAEVFCLETGEKCGSYDDVALEGDHDVISGELGFNYVSDFDGGNYLCDESDDTTLAASSLDNMRGAVNENMLKHQRVAGKSAVISLGPKTTPFQVNMCSSMSEIWQQSKLIKPDTQASKLNQLKTGLKISMKVQKKSKLPQKNSKTNTRSSFARPIVGVSHFSQTPKSSFSIYSDPVEPSRDFCDTKRVLRSLSANILNSKSDCSLKGVQRVTPPLCSCGRRAKRQVVSNGGPNHGRGFYCCAVRRLGGTGRIQKGCEFFKWESAVIKSNSVASAAARSSVSLCRVNPFLSRQPMQRLSRKSF